MLLTWGFCLKGEYIAKTDAHCSFSQGYDRILLENIKDNEVHIPLRYFLDTEKWELMDKAPCSIDKLVYLEAHKKKLHGEQWKNRERKFKDDDLVETMCFQGSFWCMSRKHFDTVLGELQEDGYGTFVYTRTIGNSSEDLAFRW